MYLVHDCIIYVDRANTAGFAIISGDEVVFNTTEWKRKNLPYKCFSCKVPEWVASALKAKQVVKIDSCEIRKKDRFHYPVMRGKVLTPRIEEVVDTEYHTFSNGSGFYVGCKEIKVIETIHHYDHIKISAGKREKIICIFGITEEEADLFKQQNPLPPSKYNRWEEIVDHYTKIEKISLEEVIEIEGEVVKPCEHNVWYDYRVQKDLDNRRMWLTVKEEVFDHRYSEVRKPLRTKSTKVANYSLKNSYIATEDGPKYESEDGRGWRSESFRYRYDVYTLHLEDGREMEHVVSTRLG